MKILKKNEYYKNIDFEVFKAFKEIIITFFLFFGFILFLISNLKSYDTTNFFF